MPERIEQERKLEPSGRQAGPARPVRHAEPGPPPERRIGDDRSAIAALPDLYDEFRAVIDNMTDEEVWNMMERSLLEVRGDRHWCPDDADTWTRPSKHAR